MIEPRLRHSRRSFLAVASSSVAAWGLGRVPSGGGMTVVLPWPVDRVDPHTHDDFTSAVFAAAIADPLFALDDAGRVYPALASGPPEPAGNGLKIQLRPNLMSARGRALDARDVVFSLTRAAQHAAGGVLAELGRITLEAGLVIRVAARDPELVARALASPATAIVPRGFSPHAPDGTGAFRATPGKDRLLLTRNAVAARGAAHLERIEVRRGATLADSLRAFEARETDLSWLGEYLHRPRPGALRYDAGTVGWVVLRTGADAGSWGAPGVAQSLLDAIAPSQLAHLGLVGLPTTPRGNAAWGGEPAEVLVPDDCPHLAQIARQLAALLGRPGHELRAAERPRAELAQRRKTDRFALMLELVRRVAPGGRGALLSLLSHASPELAKRPPAHAPDDPRRLGATLRVGVVGELPLRGAQVPELSALSRWDLGATYRRK